MDLSFRQGRGPEGPAESADSTEQQFDKMVEHLHAIKEAIFRIRDDVDMIRQKLERIENRTR